MLLPTQELQLFFKLHRTLMFFVNQRLKVLPDKIATPEEFAALSPEQRIRVRDALNDNLDLIESFTAENRLTCRTTNSTSFVLGGIW